MGVYCKTLNTSLLEYLNFILLVVCQSFAIWIAIDGCQVPVVDCLCRLSYVVFFFLVNLLIFRQSKSIFYHCFYNTIYIKCGSRCLARITPQYLQQPQNDLLPLFWSPCCLHSALSFPYQLLLGKFIMANLRKPPLSPL